MEIIIPGVETLDEKLQKKAELIQKEMEKYDIIEPRFLMSSYLYDIPETIGYDERLAYNVDIALYSYQRALYESHFTGDLRAANHHYEYYHIRRRSQTVENDIAYSAFRAFAIAQSNQHPAVLYHISKRTKSLTSHVIKYCLNVMRGYHNGGTEAEVEAQIERIHDDKACRLILDMPRAKANKLETQDVLVSAIFDAANALPEYMRYCRLKPMVANSLVDSRGNKNQKLTAEVQPYFKNYVENPKPNGYRSLHSCYETLKDKEQVEFQLRTFEWHYNAEYGTAKHIGYKQSQLARVIDALDIELLSRYEYRYAFVQFLDIMNLDVTRIIVPNFYSDGENTLDKAGILIPVTTSEEVFCSKAKHMPFPLTI